MSFLYPLFLAGFAAVGLPIILHMIRRHTRKRVTFSSLMFLRTTLPRFKNREASRKTCHFWLYAAPALSCWRSVFRVLSSGDPPRRARFTSAGG